MIKTNEKYEALGFVEALIAIMVAGIACSVLMEIAASTMQGLMRAETSEKLVLYARSGAVIAQEIATNEVEFTEDNKTFKQVDAGKCYRLLSVEQYINEINPEYDTSNDSVVGYLVDTINSLPLDSITSLTDEGREAAKLEEDDQFFRWMCVDTKNEDAGIVTLKFVTGVINAEGKNTSNTDTKDYVYISIVKYK